MKAFFDTNILVYAMIDGPRCAAATALLAEGGAIGVQSLNEFTAVALRKFGFSFEQITASVQAITTLTGEPLPLTYAVHETGRHLAERYRFSVYDAMLLAAALAAGCQKFYSEDLHDGLLVERQLRIVNPFHG